MYWRILFTCLVKVALLSCPSYICFVIYGDNHGLTLVEVVQSKFKRFCINKIYSYKICVLKYIFQLFLKEGNLYGIIIIIIIIYTILLDRN